MSHRTKQLVAKNEVNSPFASGIEGKTLLYKGEICRIVRMTADGIVILYKRRAITIKDSEVQDPKKMTVKP